MMESFAIPSNVERKESMDYAFLRKKGIEMAQKYSGKIWTDFNDHDPGVTLLEQLCFALTDLSYRTDFEIQRILEAGRKAGEDALADTFFSPFEILPSHPVTPNDYRRLLIDRIAEVKNAWVTPDLSHGKGIKGIYSVALQVEEDLPESRYMAVIKEARKYLDSHRNLGEDFGEIEIFDTDEISVSAIIYLANDAMGETVMGKLIAMLEEYFNPSLRFYSLEELLEEGYPLDKILEGPHMINGYVKNEDLKALPSEIRISELSEMIAAMDGVVGVDLDRFVVKKNGIAVTGDALSLSPKRLPRLAEYLGPGNEGFERIRFKKGNIPYSLNANLVSQIYAEHSTRFKTSYMRKRGKEGKESKKPVSVKGLDQYYSIQRGLPAIYGVGTYGPLRKEDPLLRGRAKQLKGYLLIFEQLMANYLAQLAEVKNLFAIEEYIDRSYFGQAPLDVPYIEEVLRNPRYESYSTSLQEAYKALRRTANQLKFAWEEEFKNFENRARLKGFDLALDTLVNNLKKAIRGLKPPDPKAGQDPEDILTAHRIWVNRLLKATDEFRLQAIREAFKANLDRLMRKMDPFFERRNRFLDHLLARFAEVGEAFSMVRSTEGGETDYHLQVYITPKAPKDTAGLKQKVFSSHDEALAFLLENGKNPEDFEIRDDLTLAKIRLLKAYDDLSKNRSSGADYHLHFVIHPKEGAKDLAKGQFFDTREQALAFLKEKGGTPQDYEIAKGNADSSYYSRLQKKVSILLNMALAEDEPPFYGYSSFLHGAGVAQQTMSGTETGYDIRVRSKDSYVGFGREFPKKDKAIAFLKENGEHPSLFEIVEEKKGDSSVFRISPKSGNSLTDLEYEEAGKLYSKKQFVFFSNQAGLLADLLSYGLEETNYQIFSIEEEGEIRFPIVFTSPMQEAAIKVFEGESRDESEKALKQLLKKLKALQKEAAVKQEGFYLLEHILLRSISPEKFTFQILDDRAKLLLKSYRPGSREAQLTQARNILVPGSMKHHYYVQKKEGKWQVILKERGAHSLDVDLDFISKGEAEEYLQQVLLPAGSDTNNYDIKEIFSGVFEVRLKDSQDKVIAIVETVFSNKEQAEDYIQSLAAIFQKFPIDHFHINEVEVYPLEVIDAQRQVIFSEKKAFYSKDEAEAFLDRKYPDARNEKLFPRVGAPMGKAFKILLMEPGKPIARMPEEFDAEQEATRRITEAVADLKEMRKDNKLNSRLSIVPEDRSQDQRAIDDRFFSNQLSLVLPDWIARFQDENFRRYFENVISEQAPAHLVLNFHWWDFEQIKSFEATFEAWWETKRSAQWLLDENPESPEIEELDTLSAQLTDLLLPDTERVNG